jgi:hypothetical protein
LQEIRKQDLVSDSPYQPRTTNVNRSVVMNQATSAERDKVQSQPSLSANGDDIDFNVDIKDLSDLNAKQKT